MYFNAMFYVFLFPTGALKFKFCHKTGIHLQGLWRSSDSGESLLISMEIMLY